MVNRKKKFVSRRQDLVYQLVHGERSNYGELKLVSAEGKAVACCAVVGDDDDEYVGKKIGDEDLLLSGECYFPKDGYDYEQHLMVLNPGGILVGSFSESDPVKDRKQKRNSVDKKMYAAGCNNNLFFSAEEQEVAWCLEEPELFDDLEEDAALKLLSEKRGEEREVLWGCQHGVFGGAAVLDQSYDRIMCEYGQEKIGNLEEEFDNIQDSQQRDSLLLDVIAKDSKHSDEEEGALEEADVEYICNYLEQETLDDEFCYHRETRAAEQWDCETLLTTKSTLFNHPYTVCRPVRVKPASLLQTVKESNALVSVRNSDDDCCCTEERVVIASVSTFRPKGEATEDKRARKSAIKEAQRMARVANAKRLAEQVKPKKHKAARNPYDVNPGVRCFSMT